MDNSTTLVLDATGKTGRRVAARLRLRGTPVHAASRSSRTPFDWTDLAGWDRALRGIATVCIVPPTVPGPVHDFVTRAEAAGVQRLVLLSTPRWSSASWHFRPVPSPSRSSTWKMSPTSRLRC
ncbi:hypothetical protein [Streptomyces sp. DSM 41529]|uniref:NmrA-like family protein n=1 Tax=Streptomyces lonegramiae TaxID=3075524 RepID=A0ABU2XWH0_9ACTN|nr:hypothetical protein [Streptomyces sp. DSM 41529]MDT0549400.1 hypothetical protein [Streptomyces sp. DSM 41529]